MERIERYVPQMKPTVVHHKERKQLSVLGVNNRRLFHFSLHDISTDQLGNTCRNTSNFGDEKWIGITLFSDFQTHTGRGNSDLRSSMLMQDPPQMDRLVEMDQKRVHMHPMIRRQRPCIRGTDETIDQIGETTNIDKREM
eukprot:29239_1